MRTSELLSRILGVVVVGLLVVGLLVGCDGGGKGVQSDGSVTGDASGWSYSCPAEQTGDGTCIRGQVLELYSGAAVEVPDGVTVTLFSVEEADAYPNTEVAEAEVQPDGRFIFPTVPAWMTQPCRADTDATEILGQAHVFSFRLNGAVPGNDTPDNRHGAFDHAAIFPLYVIADSAVVDWETAWNDTRPGHVHDLALDSDDKNVISVCSGVQAPGEIPLPRLDMTTLCRIDPLTFDCHVSQLLEGLDQFLWDVSTLSPSGLAVSSASPAPDGDETMTLFCSYNASPAWGIRESSLGRFGPADVDHSSPLVIMHMFVNSWAAP